MSINSSSLIEEKKCFRLLDFNIYDEATDSTTGEDSSNSDEDKSKKDEKQFVIQIFGLNEKGQTCCIFIRDYEPFFYLKVDDNWNLELKKAFINHIKNHKEISAYYRDSIIESECKLIKRKKLYGFDGGREYKFIIMKFKNSIIMNKVKNLWYYTFKGARYLKKDGYPFQDTNIILYEANIPPLLRYFHIKEISPSGWIMIQNNKTKPCIKPKTTCNFEFELQSKDILPLNNKETIVPYKICSFDIEASSSHGDFPIPIKTYKKLATNIIDICNVYKNNSIPITSDILLRIILTAFHFDNFDDVDRIYTIHPVSKERITSLFHSWILLKIHSIETNQEMEETNTIEKMFEALSTNNEPEVNHDNSDDDFEDDDDDNASVYSVMTEKKSSYKSPKNKLKNNDSIIDYLNQSTNDRETQINNINNTLMSIFPKVEGDKVTFIGSTFLTYGSQKPYLNHCITLDTCSDLHTEVANSQIESYKTEKDVLLAWTKLIQKENPDIIIGYNICGFDYEFMFRRALENHCENEFLLLSRNKNEFCGNKDYKTGKVNIEESSIVIASGQHDLHYIKMTGRLQIDLYNYFRRDFNLTSYKLDYCAGYFIGDSVKKLEYLESPTRTKIISGNLMGLENGNYINFEESSHSTDAYKDGEKFKVMNVDSKTGTFEILGHENPDMTKSVRWGLAKDDVTPQDIFRLTKGSADDRAIIAKYCIQDCNLVHHLMNKIDVITGYIEMAKICSVPISFLVLRGQGIKLTSFIAKKCREKRTLMPVIEKGNSNDSYEGAIVLPPKCNLYLDNPVACLDYSSLYPSSMISENLSHDSKVWTKEYNLTNELIKETGEKDASGNFIYDNLPDYDYVDVTYDTYRWIPNARGKAIKTVSGKKICRFAQFKEGKAIMPSVLEELLAARKATRKLAEAAEDPFLANILDKRQLAYKVTAHSLYGQCGAKTSTFYEVDVAASTTATGRKLLTYGKRIVEEVYGNAIVESKKYGFVNTKAEYIYGDSVANYTPIYIRENQGDVEIITIEKSIKFGKENSWKICKEKGKEEKEFCEMRDNIETWSDKGWTKLHRVIRHKLANHKKIIRVSTNTGVVDVTDDHSLLLKNGQEISPKNIKIGTELLHNPLIHNKKIICNFNEINNNKQLISAWMFNNYLQTDYKNLKIINDSCFNIEILDNENKFNETNITNITEIEYPKGEYVYDLTTDNHHFAAGVGNIIVHNTDSVFFTFNLATPDGIPIRGKDALEITIEIAREVGHLASKFLKPPHAWVYEKTLMPFCLLSKKRYVGMLYEDKPEKPKRKSMGIVLKRRDNAPIVKDIYGGIIDILMKDQNIEKAMEFLKSCLKNMVDEKVPLDKLIITKSLRSGYKNPQQIAHKVLADRMGKRDPGNKPSVGDRIPFVYIQTDNKKALQGEKIEHPNFIIQNKLKPNYAFYITNQIMKPVQQVFALVLENIPAYKRQIPSLKMKIEEWIDKIEDNDKLQKKITDIRNKEVKKLLFDEFLTQIDNATKKNQSILTFFKKT